MTRLVELDASVLAELYQSLRNARSDDEVKSSLRAHWAKLVPKFFPATRTPLKPEYVQKRTDRYLIDPLSSYIADRPASEVQRFFDSLKEDEKSSLCNKFFKTGEPTFCCRDCATDATCVMCMECFRNSSHKNHRYKMNMSVGGGMCDCGDAEAFISGHACSIHDVGEQPEKSSHEVLANVPADIVRRMRLVVEECLQYCIDLLANKGDDADRDTDVTGGMPVDLMPPDSSSHVNNSSSDSELALTHVTVLFNDEIHTYDQVISALGRTLIDCSAQQATDFASKVDRDGRAPIAFGTKGECDRYKLSIERNSRRPFPLRVVVLRADAYAHQVFALNLISWLTAKTTETEKMKAVLCRVGLTQAANHSSSMVSVFLNNDRNMWKGARMAYQQLFLQCYLQFSDTKLEFTNIYGQLYPVLTRRFVLDEGHAHSDSCTSMSVQIFTVPSLARFLISHKAMHNILAALEDVMYNAFAQSETGTLMFYKISDKEKALLKRWFYILNDVKYLLNTVPAIENWSSELVEGFELASDTLINILGMLEGMDANVRQTSSHLEYEPDWEMGFNLAFRVNGVFYSFVQWCMSNQAVIEHVIYNAFLQLSSILTRSVTVHTPAPPPPLSMLNANGEAIPPPLPLRPSGRDQTKTRPFQLQDVGVMEHHSFKVIKFDVATETASVHCALSRLTASLVAHCVVLLEHQQQQQPSVKETILHRIFDAVVQKFQRNDRTDFRSNMPSREATTVSRQALQDRQQFMLELVRDVPSLCRVLVEMPLRALVLNAQVTAGMWRRNGFSLVHQLYFYQSNKAREFMIDKDYLALQIAGAVMQPDEFLVCLLHKFDLLEWSGCFASAAQQQPSLAGTALNGIQPTQSGGSREVDALQTSLFSAEQALVGFLTVLNTAGDQLGANLTPNTAQQLQSLTAATSDVMRHSSPSSTRTASQTSVVAEEFLQTLLTVAGERYSTLLGNVSRRDIIEYELVHQLCIQPMSHSEIMRNLPADDDEEDGMELRTEVSAADDDMDVDRDEPIVGRGKRKAHQESRDAIVDSLLQQVATFRQPQSGAKGLFLLKPKYYQRYNMFFCHYNRHDMSKAETHMAETAKNQQPRAADDNIDHSATTDGHSAAQKTPVFVPPAPPALKPSFSGLVRLFDCDLVLVLLKSVFEGAIVSSSNAASSSSISNELRASSDGQSLRAAFFVAYALYEERRQLIENATSTAAGETGGSSTGNDSAPRTGIEFCRKARESGLLHTMSVLSNAANLPNVTGYLKYVTNLFQHVEKLRTHPREAPASGRGADETMMQLQQDDNDSAAQTARAQSEEAAAAEKQRVARLRRERVMSHMKQMQSNFATKHHEELRVIEQQQNSGTGDRLAIGQQQLDALAVATSDDADMIDENASAATAHPVCCGQKRTWQHAASVSSIVGQKFTCILCAEEQRIDMSGTSSNAARSGGDALVYVSFVERSSVLSHAHQRGTEKMNKLVVDGEWQADGIFFRQTQAERTFLLDNRKAISSADIHEYCVDRRAGMSPHISTCGHVMHLHCWTEYFDSSMARETRRHPRLAASGNSPAETFDVLKNEYRCPLCSRLSNAIMPLMHPQTVYLLQNGEAFARARHQSSVFVTAFDDWLRFQLDSMPLSAPVSTLQSPKRLPVDGAAAERQRRRLTVSGGSVDAGAGRSGEAAQEAAGSDQQMIFHIPTGSHSASDMLVSGTPLDTGEISVSPAIASASAPLVSFVTADADHSVQHRRQIRRRSAANRVEAELPLLTAPEGLAADDGSRRPPSSTLPSSSSTAASSPLLDIYGDFLYRSEGVAPPPRLGEDHQRALALARAQVWQVFSDRGQLLSPSSPSLSYNDHLKVMIRAIAYSVQSMEVALRFDGKALFNDYSFRQQEALRGLMGCFSWIRHADNISVSSSVDFAVGASRANHEKLYWTYADELFRPLLLLLQSMEESEADQRFAGANVSLVRGTPSAEFFTLFARLMERDLFVMLVGMLTMTTAGSSQPTALLNRYGSPTEPPVPARRVSHDPSLFSQSQQQDQRHRPLNNITQLGRSILGTIRHSLQPAAHQQSNAPAETAAAAGSNTAPSQWRRPDTLSSAPPSSAVHCVSGPSGSVNDHQLLKLFYGLHILQVMLSMPFSEMTKEFDTENAELTEQSASDAELRTLKAFLFMKLAQGEISQSVVDEILTNNNSDTQRCCVLVTRRLREALSPFLRGAALVFHFATLISPPASLTTKPPPSSGGDNADQSAFVSTQFESLCRYLDLPLTLHDFQSESEVIDLLVRQLTATTSHDGRTQHQKKFMIGSKRLLFRYPMALPEFTTLPKDYSEVMCMSATFTCRRDDADENLSPTLCLLCGKMLCSSLYCCTYQIKTGESVGACNYHSLVCGAGTGIFLRMRESMLTMMYGIRKHCLYAAPYVDRYGECDPFLRRGNPLTLSTDRLHHILKQYVHHNIADEVVQLFEQQNGGQLALQQL